MTRRRFTSAKVACQVIDPTALFGQALLAPVSEGRNAAGQVARP